MLLPMWPRDLPGLVKEMPSNEPARPVASGAMGGQQGPPGGQPLEEQQRGVLQADRPHHRGFVWPL